jgi:ABC-2 type transport system permease protein
MFTGLLALLILASLGIGLLISILSKSETQAVQLSMLMLLLSIFFGGFFLPLENFWEPIRAVSYLLPLTPGILGLQDIMLRGIAPQLWIWLLLGGSALVTFLLVNLFAGRQLRFEQT